MIDDIRKLREAHRAADDTLFAQQNRVRTKEQQLAALKEQNAAVRDHLRTGSIVQADTTEQQP